VTSKGNKGKPGGDRGVAAGRAADSANRDEQRARLPATGQGIVPTPLRSIDLLLDDPHPPQVTILGADQPAAPSATGLPPHAAADGAQASTASQGPASAPVSGPRRPPPPRVRPALTGGASTGAAPTDPRAGYVDDGEIGRGGMGSVRVAIDQRMHRKVAMKLFEPATDGSERLARRFVDEAQVTGQLDHPHIVPIHELALDARGMPSFFTMKLVRGHHLGQVIDDLGEDRLEARNLERIVKIVLKICDAVSFAHSHGVIHRDLKPGNVMVGSHGQVYVMDWGLALVRAATPKHDEAEERLHAIGTPAFMAPEQAWARLEEIDERTDVYGLGGILYYALTGGPPHVADDPLAAIQHAREGTIRHPGKAKSGRPQPPELCRITMRALATRPADRYASVVELQGELEQFMRGGGWLETRSYEPGAQIIREGDDADEAFIIVSGTCEAYRTVRGKRTALQRMGPGQIFGETVLLTGRKRQASVSAVDAVTLKVITRHALDCELAGSAWVKTFVTVLAERFREVAAKLALMR